MSVRQHPSLRDRIVRQWLGPRLQQRLQRAGLHLSLYGVRSSLDIRRGRLLETARVDLFLDVGANEGQYAQGLRDFGYRGEIISFEPQEAPFRALAERCSTDPLWTAHRLALGAQKQSFEINVAGRSVDSSFLRVVDNPPPWMPYEGTVYAGSERVQMTTLDEVVGELVPVDRRLGLKLDVQGYEAQVLGATHLLTRVVYAESEMILERAYVDQASPNDLISTFYDAGLHLVSTANGEVDETTGIVGWIDCSFVRELPEASRASGSAVSATAASAAAP